MSRKGENIYKRKDGRWEARYVKGYGEDGKAKYAYLYAGSYREVKERLDSAKAALMLGESSGGIVPKVAVIAHEWLEVCRHKISPSSYVKYAAVIKNHIISELGGVRIDAIGEARIAAFTNSLLCEKCLSPKTVRDILTMLGSILKYAKKKLGVRIHTPEIIYPKYNVKEMRVLAIDEQKRLTHFLTTDTDERKFGVLLALMTGLRIGELCALKWQDISLNERCIRVRFTMQRLGDVGKKTTSVVISAPKSEKSARIIPLTDVAVRLCSKFRAADEAYVLTGTADNFCEPRIMQHYFGKIATDLGLEGVHFHTLRHTFATRCVEVGFEVKSLSEILGHASPQITLERYVHSSLELKRDNMQKLAVFGF